MAENVEIELFNPGKFPDEQLTYVVIGAIENREWIFVRHKERSTWELPAGHIEVGESAEHAAKRELFEETGTVNSEMYALHDYAVKVDGAVNYGRIYYATVKKRENKPPSEIAEIRISTKTPFPATYPEAHERFIDVLQKHFIQVE